MKENDGFINQIERLMDRIFDRRHFGYLHHGEWKPPMDIYETTDGFVVLMDLPGVKIEDVEVLVKEGVLSIKGQRADPSPPNKIRCYQVEVGQGHFCRQVSLGCAIDEDNIRASLKDGLLEVDIPKEKR